MRWTSSLAALCAFSCGCFVLPPSRTDVGLSARGATAGHRFAVGGHSASVSKRLDVPVDLGAGYVYERIGETEAQHGNYIELSKPLWSRDRVRVSAGGRVELFWNDVGPLGVTRGLSARVSVEHVFGHAARTLGVSRTAAAIYGLFAPGLFIEGGIRSLQGGQYAGAVVAGLSVRLPFVAVASAPTSL